MKRATRHNKPDSETFKDSEALTSFGQAYFASEFANPNRTGCFGAGEIRRLVRSKDLPGEAVRQHVFNCSECFRAYRREMKLLHPATVKVERRRWLDYLVPSGRHLLAYTAASALLALLVGGTYLFLRTRPPETALVAQNIEKRDSTTGQPKNGATGNHATNEAIPDPAATLKKRVMAPQPKLRSRGDRHPAEELPVVEVDLREAVLRDSDTQRRREDHPIGVSPVKTFIRVRLPMGSIQGVYRITIVDPYGKVLVQAYSRSRDGKALRASLDLRQLSEDKCWLCVAREDEAPDCHPVIVMNKRPPSVGNQ